MRRWIAGLLMLCGQFAGAKTRLLVEDPNNVVAGRYSLTAPQETQARLSKLRFYGRFDDYVAVYLGGATGLSKDGYAK